MSLCFVAACTHGLLLTGTDGCSSVKEVVFSIIAGLGIGCLFQTPLIGESEGVHEIDERNGD